MPRGVPGSRSAHGTVTRYFKQGCRCEECQEAQRRYSRSRGRPGRPLVEYREAVAAACGSAQAYRNGCRCDECRAASAAEKRAHRARHREHYRAYDRTRRKQL
jgi:hypothetical protein